MPDLGESENSKFNFGLAFYVRFLHTNLEAHHDYISLSETGLSLVKSLKAAVETNEKLGAEVELQLSKQSTLDVENAKSAKLLHAAQQSAYDLRISNGKYKAAQAVAGGAKRKLEKELYVA